MRYFYIPEEFFKLIAEKGKLYSRVWFYWLSEFVDEIFEPDFLEKQEKLYTSKVGEISEIYHFGVQLLQHNFKIIEEKEKKKESFSLWPDCGFVRRALVCVNSSMILNSVQFKELVATTETRDYCHDFVCQERFKILQLIFQLKKKEFDLSF